MIALKISSTNKNCIEQITILLLESNMIIDPEIEDTKKSVYLKNKQLVATPIFSLTAKTRALLFSKIDKLIRDKYADNLPEIYSLPIVNMDYEQTNHLVKTLS